MIRVQSSTKGFEMKIKRAEPIEKQKQKTKKWGLTFCSEANSKTKKIELEMEKENGNGD